jgi:polysaccharide export outer membrane protein
MKRWFYIGIIGGIIGSLVICMSSLIAYSQTEKGVLNDKGAKAKSNTDNASYVIGPEDVLYIHVWKEDALSRTLPVRMDGNISLPLIHQIKAAGLTPLELEEVIAKRLNEFYEKPIVSVTVMEANSFKVYVSGEVRTPGVYNLRSETNLLQIIPMAGGFTEWANQKKILIIRKEMGKESRITVDYKKVIKGESNSNVVLRPGDTVIVPK